MTEADQKKVKEMIQDGLLPLSNEILGRLNVLCEKMVRIEANTERTEKHAEKTNGKVAEHEKEIYLLKESNATHMIKCPQTKEIHEINQKITTLEKMEVGREAVQKFTWKQLTGIGIVAGIVFGFLKFVIDFIIQR
jgi:tetrahydromethanopterin S-methyltransferase subunit G